MEYRITVCTAKRKLRSLRVEIRCICSMQTVLSRNFTDLQNEFREKSNRTQEFAYSYKTNFIRKSGSWLIIWVGMPR